MSTLNSVIKNRYGKHFKIQHPRESKIELTLTPEFFWNENSAKQFISNSTVANSYWRDIIQQYSNIPSPASLSVNDVEKYICTLLMQGQLQIFPIDVPDVSEHPPENRAIKASDNVTYLFAPVSTLLTTTPKEVKKFAKQKDADKFLSELSADKKKLKILSSELNIDLPQTSSVNSGEILESISKALFLGTTIVIVDRFTGTPPKDEIVESAREADKPVPLAPEKEKYESVVIDFQIDVDAQRNRNDILTLIGKEAGYESIIYVGDLWEFDNDWVRLNYLDPPPSGTYSLYHDPKDGEVPYTIFKDVPYASLKELTPECDEMVIHDDEDEKEEEGNNEQSASA